MSSNHEAPGGQAARKRVLRKIEKIEPQATLTAPVELSPPPAARERDEAPRPVRSAISAPTLRTPLPSEPGIVGHYPSVPPVSASVPPPEPLQGAGAAQPARRSAWRSAVVGAGAGLLIVAAFVTGARVSLHRASTTAAASPGALPAPRAIVAAPAPPRAAAPALPVVQAPATATQPAMPALMPLVQADQLPIARPAHHWGPPKHGAKAAPADVAAAAPVASAAGTDDTDDDTDETDEGAASMTPVIPQAAPPPVDPLVKAVQSDIDEDEASHR